ncbi:galactofuranosyltransferase [Parabacteroides sp. OttesenSCG-928-B22]|nr:galactofuranosyltransferase [Parabacteroides sp. OttesenSCG-928-B22]
MRRCYLSKNYKETYSAGNKAKTDIEKIMQTHGFVNVGLPASYSSNEVWGFIYTFCSVMKSFFSLRRGDVLVLQYPLKKYYSLVCRFAQWKGAKTVTLIHDLGCFRRKKLTIEQEKRRLSRTNGILALNESEKNWLIAHGYTQPIEVTGLWDYLSDAQPIERPLPERLERVMHAGSLTPKRHSFLYAYDKAVEEVPVQFVLYGNDFEAERVRPSDRYIKKGFVRPDELIATAEGDFSLIWYGHSYQEVDGGFGEYMQITTPHKPSLYIRCHTPMIVWEKLAIYPLIEKEHIGIGIDSLEELESVIRSVTREDYKQMKENIQRISQLVAEGHFFLTAYAAIELKLLSKDENRNSH